MIYITGDCHSNFIRFSAENFPEQKEMTRDDIVIVLGDFGGVWEDTKEERYWLDWLSEKPFTLCYVGGNHENYDRYLHSDEFETVDFHGGKAQKVRDNIYHLLRGYVFEFEGKKFFSMGGASSHDIDDGILDLADFESKKEFDKTCKEWRNSGKRFRINHVSWWKEELPSEEELEFGLKTLNEHNFEVDYVITHCLPNNVEAYYSMGLYHKDKLTVYFEDLLNKGLKFVRWFCGHYHTNTAIFNKFLILYEQIIRIK